MNRFNACLRSTPPHWLFIYLGSVVYFCLLAIVNIRGAADKNMLSIFQIQIDEFVIYDVVSKMMQADLRHFLDPIQHVYGYLYHFINAFALMVFRPLNHIFGLSQTTFDVLILRQLSALYYLVAVMLLLKTFFVRAHPLSIISAWFAVITLPAVFSNNTWMHPDNLAFLLFALTCVALVRDQDKFGKWFWSATIFWGLAINTKMYGVFLFPLFAYYCLRKPISGYREFRLALLRLFGAGGGAVLIYLLTMPFLFFGNNFYDFFKAMTDYSATYVTGSRNSVEEAKPLLWYRTVINEGYFHWIFIVCLAVGIYSFLKISYRIALILLVATVPMLLHFLLNVGWTGFWYLIPTLVPLISLAFFMPSVELKRMSGWQKWALGMTIPIMGWQMVHNVSTSVTWASKQFHKEESSSSIALYRKVEQVMGDRMRRVHSAFRDPHVYLPAIESVRVKMKWGLANYEDIQNETMDMVVLQKDYIARCSSEVELRKYMEYMKQDFNENVRCIKFYSDAKQRKLKGYDFLVENEFGMAFIRSGL